MAIIVNFSMDDKADRDILAWLDKQSNKSAAIRLAIRAYIARTEGPTLADVLAEVRALPSRLRVVSTTTGDAQDIEGDEPEAAAANLNGLLDRLVNGDLG